MKRRPLAIVLGAAFTAVSLAALSAPAEVLENLDFFSDFEMFLNLEVFEGDKALAMRPVLSTGPAVAAGVAGLAVSTQAVKVSTFTGRGYGKN